MLVTLMCKDKLYGVLLPERVRGRYWIEDRELELTDSGRRILSIEGENGIWKITARRNLKLYASDHTEVVPQLELEVGKMYVVELYGGREGYIFTESYTENRCVFKKYSVQPNVTFNIGKSADNKIVIDNPYVSSVHAQFSLVGDTWTVSDNNSKNGVYVNEKRLYHSMVLHPGDVIYILGVKIVIGYHFIALNNPDEVVKLDKCIFKPYQPEILQPYEEPDEIEEKIYYRSPRFWREIEALVLKIDAPARQEKEDDTPLILTLAPSLVMGVASFSSGLVSMTNTLRNGGNMISSVPTLIMSVSMLMGMVMFPFIMRTRDRKRKKGKEVERQEKYLKYLEIIRAEINKESGKQKEILNENYPLMLTLVKNESFYDMTLWSRVIGQNNFLSLRVGMGNVPLQAKLVFPEQRFSIEDDMMREEVNRFSEERQMITGVPVVYSLVEHRVSGIVGNGNIVNAMLHNLLIQLAALHSYDELKIIFICDEANFYKYDYVRWMPHIWSNNFKKRFLAVNQEEVRNLSAFFLREIEKYREEQAFPAPHYVVISTSKVLSDNCAFLSELLKDASLECFSYLAVYDELKNLPKECSMILQVNNKQGMMFDYRKTGEGQINFMPDMVPQEEAEEAIRKIAEYRLDLQSGKYELPDVLTFLDMYQVGKYEHLNVANRWKTSNPVASLQAPVGVNSDGDLFYLDLHEEAHGPHGLIAGMTGSGKSEFIITYVLSMAVNYSPEDVAFILIDYKGGGLAGAFESEQYHLPHLAGTITNLDGAAINRSLISIQSELKRRQRVFGKARQIANEGTMDIYKYQKLYRNGIVTEPMPHLLIISDEFAELKSQEPEFMAQLISTARIGRSLGVHLILATQKPSGVVSDQIWANSRFKVSLKVQDRADSMEMLKRPDAAELVETGRFYLQVGYNELFELGQSAWCGAPYIPKDAVSVEKDERVQMLDHQGNVVEESKPQKAAVNSGEARKQIVEIVQYLTQMAEEEHLKASPLWQPEIPARIMVEELEKKYRHTEDYGLNPIIGELDDPYNQDQRLLTIPFAEGGNAICYGGTGSGKEDFLIAALYSLYRSHTSAGLNTYILDFGTEILQIFEEAPQTGGFVVSGEDEKVVNLFHMLHREVMGRKKQFAKLGGDYLSYCRSGRNDVPSIVVIINGYANFAEQYEAMDEQMVSLTRECTKYGIYFLVTSLTQMGIRYKLQQNFSQIFVLQMNDKSEYTAILGNTGGVYPSKILGRGIVREKDVYEFQTACVTQSAEQTMDAVKEFCKRLKESGQNPAKPIPVMPKAVFRRHLDTEEVSFEKVPIGISADTVMPVYINLKKRNVCQVLSDDRQNTVAFIEGLANMLQAVPEFEIYVIDPGQLLSVNDRDERYYISGQPEDMVVSLFQLTVERHNTYKLAEERMREEADWHPVITILMGLSQIKKQLSEDGRDKLRLILEKTSGKFGLFFWVVDDVQSANRYSEEKWCSGDGIWIGNGINEQVRLKVNSRNQVFAKKLDFTSGYLVRKANARLVRLLISERLEQEAEDVNDE